MTNNVTLLDYHIEQNVKVSTQVKIENIKECGIQMQIQNTEVVSCTAQYHTNDNLSASSSVHSTTCFHCRYR
jgi:hypothetical protein